MPDFSDIITDNEVGIAGKQFLGSENIIRKAFLNPFQVRNLMRSHVLMLIFAKEREIRRPLSYIECTDMLRDLVCHYSMSFDGRSTKLYAKVVQRVLKDKALGKGKKDKDMEVE